MKQRDRIEVGEKYLVISILGQIRLTAFKNKQKIHHNEADYEGNGVKIWVNRKMEDKDDL